MPIGQGHFTNYQEERLARYTNMGQLRYRDLDAFCCRACRGIFNVKCPICSTWSRKNHTEPETLLTFRTIDDTIELYDGRYWRMIQCQNCDYKFKVLVK